MSPLFAFKSLPLSELSIRLRQRYFRPLDVGNVSFPAKRPVTVKTVHVSRNFGGNFVSHPARWSVVLLSGAKSEASHDTDEKLRVSYFTRGKFCGQPMTRELREFPHSRYSTWLRTRTIFLLGSPPRSKIWPHLPPSGRKRDDVSVDESTEASKFVQRIELAIPLPLRSPTCSLFQHFCSRARRS